MKCKEYMKTLGWILLLGCVLLGLTIGTALVLSAVV